MSGKRLVVVSNRLPVALRSSGGRKQLVPSTGGLVTALTPILSSEGGLWVGWAGPGDPGDVERLTGEYNRGNAYQIHPVHLNERQVERFYFGFSNQTIWPLFHDFLGLTRFERDHWEMYDAVNRIYAEHVARLILPEDFVWINDYQLMRVGHHLRELGVEQPLAYFHHIPFPSPDLYRRLPWARQIFDGLLCYGSIGFQTLRDRRNFIALSRERLRTASFHIRRRETVFEVDGRRIHAGNYPISIDYDEFNKGARGREVKREIEMIRASYRVEHLVLGLDRLDYTKGIPQRFLALERLLELHPEMVGKVTLIQVVVPSRVKVRRYAELKEQLDSLTGRINGRFGRYGYMPIHYFFKHLTRTELLGLYRACEVALITPLRDGMNLVAKEFAASSVDHRSVLVLSEFTGSADQLGKGALLVNPYDLDGTAETLYRALHMDGRERYRRLRHLRTQVRTNDVHRWVRWFMGALTGGEEQVPSGSRRGDFRPEHPETEGEFLDPDFEIAEHAYRL